MKFDRFVLLQITSVLFILSIFIANPLLFALAITTWVFTVVYNVSVSMKDSKYSVSKLESDLLDKSTDSLHKKKYVLMTLSLIAFPAIIVGVIIVILDTGCIWYLAIK